MFIAVWRRTPDAWILSGLFSGRIAARLRAERLRLDGFAVRIAEFGRIVSARIDR